MKNLYDALQDAKKQISNLKDENLKNQLLSYISQAIEQAQNTQLWKVKTYSGNPISDTEPTDYQFADIINDKGQNFSKRLQMAVGVCGNEVFHFDFRLQGQNGEKPTNQQDNFESELADITFAPQGGLSASIQTINHNLQEVCANEKKVWLGVDKKEDEGKITTPVSTTKLKQIATDTNYNNVLVKKTIITKGPSIVNTEYTKQIELKDGNNLEYFERIAESVNDKTITDQSPIKVGTLPKNNTKQLNLDMAEYCTQNKSSLETLL